MRAAQLLPDHLNTGDFNGVTVRKGTVGAFLINARVWADRSVDDAARANAAADIVDALPALRALGLFEVLDVRDPALRKLIDEHASNEVRA
ncbi:hypothetical protein [Paraburkholderia bannensis]|uniref:hypothetical protein n=1 Tax=Paraburkholderia bannensis TaxID=765414 RepID=UPI0004844C60|nr:hypothetical protein [Paraburkholderia bannensis]